MALERFSSTEELGNAMSLLANELIAADLDYGLYSEISRLTKQYKDVYSRGWSFWLPLLGSLLGQTVLTLCRVYDTDPRTNGLPVILKRLSRDPEMVNVSLPQDIQLVSRTEPVVRRLADWRNEILAHTNYERASGIRKVERKQLLLRKDVTTLIGRGMEIYSRQTGSHMSRDINQHMIPNREAEFIFVTVQEKLDANMRDIRAWLEDRDVNPDKFLGLDPRFTRKDRTG